MCASVNMLEKSSVKGWSSCCFSCISAQGKGTLSHVGEGLNPLFKFHVFCIEQAQLTSQGRFPGTYLKSFGKAVVEHIGIIFYLKNTRAWLHN